MYKLNSILCIFSVYSIIYVYGMKSLKDNPGFDSSAAWESGYLPCALDQVIFPAAYEALLPLPKQVDVSGFILPHDGAILFNQDMIIDLAGDTIKQPRSCENGSGRRAYLKKPQIRKWYDPQSWNLLQTKNNKATTGNIGALTDLQRVPCDNEPVIITPKGPIAIDLEFVTYMRMGQLSLAGSLVTKDYLQYLLSTELGKIIFHNNKGVMVEYYRDGVCGCHRDFTHVLEPVCHNVVRNCEKAHCLEPINPYGGCCDLCGAVIRISVSRCDDVKLQTIKKLLENSRAIENLEDDIDFDINYFDGKEYGKILQIIAIDRLAYNERSVNFLKKFNTTNDWNKIVQDPHYIKLIFSGQPYHSNITFLSMLLIVLCVIFVFFVSLVIFAHYEPHHHMLRHVPTWIYDTRHWRALLTRTQNAFARFENITNLGRRGTMADVQETIVDDGGDNVNENIAIGYNAESGTIERYFDNPMFNKKSNEKYKTEVDRHHQPQPILETGSLTNTQNKEDNDIQELHEIKLDLTSDDDDSDIEAETKE